MTRFNSDSLATLPTFDDHGHLLAVVEAVRGTRNKFKYDEALHTFVHDAVLPAGASYPFDFGFVPSTRGEDGDPLDVLVLMDEAAYVGAVVPCRLVGAIEAEQTEDDGQVVRNDRLIAVAAKSHLYKGVDALTALPPNLVEQIEHFWISYNETRGKRFTPIGRASATGAAELVKGCMSS